MSAVGYEPGGNTQRANENFGYVYDGAENLLERTNNTLIEAFTTDNADELVKVSRINNSLLTVAGGVSNAPTALTVNGQGAALYADQTFAVAGVALNHGLNTLTTVVTSVGVRATTNSFPAFDGFTKKTFTAMIEGVRQSAIEAGMVEPAVFEKGIRDLYQTAGADGVFCYTFFKAVARRSSNGHLGPE